MDIDVSFAECTRNTIKFDLLFSLFSHTSGDPLSNLQVEFNTKEEAIVHCEKNGWKWWIDGEEKPHKKRNKNYGVNFSWDKRTRVSTK